MTAALAPSARRGVRRLAAHERTLAGVDVLLDAERLSTALGLAATITRVRYKRGTSLVVAYDSPAGPGWAAVFDGPDKPAKTLERAARTGSDVRTITGVRHAIAGGALTDRMLERAVRDLAKTDPTVFARARILRHNPHRRLVLDAGGRDIVKIARDGVARAVTVQERMRASGLPVLPARQLTGHAWSAPRWGAGDLALVRSPAAAREAGAALAALHAQTPVGEDVPSRSDIAAEARIAAGAVAEILPGLSARVRALASAAARIRPSVVTTVHGDFSADQVLTGDGIRLVDFDRAGSGDPLRDVASFLADDALRPHPDGVADALLDGYRDAGGTVRRDALPQWISASLLLRAVEPFRRADPDWPDAIARTVTRAEEALA